MKKAVKLTALTLALAFSSAAMADDIAFVNVDYLFSHHPARQLELKKLDDEFKAPSEKLQAADKALQEKKAAFEKEIDGKVKALDKDAPKLRQADIKKRQDEIAKLAQKRDEEFKKLVQEHQESIAKFREEVQKREIEIERKLLTDIQSATAKVAKAKSLSAVLDEKTAIYATDGKNITEDVLKSIPAPAQAK